MKAAAEREVNISRGGNKDFESEQVHPSYRVKRPRLFTKSGSYLKQYLVSERIPKDCDARIVKVLTGESKTFNFGGLPMRYFRGSEGFEGHNSTNPSEAR